MLFSDFDLILTQTDAFGLIKWNSDTPIYNSQSAMYLKLIAPLTSLTIDSKRCPGCIDIRASTLSKRSFFEERPVKSCRVPFDLSTLR